MTRHARHERSAGLRSGCVRAHYQQQGSREQSFERTERGLGSNYSASATRVKQSGYGFGARERPGWVEPLYSHGCATVGDEVPVEAIMSAVHGNGLLSAGAADSPRGGRGLADIAYAPPPAAAATSADPWSVEPRPLPPLSPCRLPPRPLPTSDAWSVEPRSLLLSYAELPNCHGAGREAQGEERHSSQVKSS